MTGAQGGGEDDEPVFDEDGRFVISSILLALQDSKSLLDTKHSFKCFQAIAINPVLHQDQLILIQNLFTYCYFVNDLGGWLTFLDSFDWLGDADDGSVGLAYEIRCEIKPMSMQAEETFKEKNFPAVDWMGLCLEML